jgi:hypothetical protein
MFESEPLIQDDLFLFCPDCINGSDRRNIKIEKKFDELKVIAKNFMIKEGHHPPIFFPILDDIVLPILLDFGADGSKKYIIQDAIRRILKEHTEFNGYIFISESWYLKKPIGEIAKQPLPRPSQHPDRQECVILNLVLRNGFKKLILCPFKRTESNKIIFAEAEETITGNNIGGEFMTLFEER